MQSAVVMEPATIKPIGHVNSNATPTDKINIDMSSIISSFDGIGAESLIFADVITFTQKFKLF